MRSPDEFIAHALAVYDPAKAHEYYLRTRQLHGRTAGAEESTSGHVKSKAFVPAKKKKSQSTQDEVNAKITALKARLAKLQTVLDQLVEAAKLRSGVDSADSTKAKDKSSKPKTSKQKAAAKKAAEKYQEKHKNDPPKTPSQQVKELESKIKAIHAKIKQMKAQIAAAKKKTKSKTGSVGASGSTIHK